MWSIKCVPSVEASMGRAHPNIVGSENEVHSGSVFAQIEHYSLFCYY